MEDLVLQERSKIESHISREYPKEICGVIAGKRRPQYIECTNISDSEDEFIIDPTEYTRLSLTRQISAIVHSHRHSCKASEWDVVQCNLHKLPFIIFGDDGYNIVHPKVLALKGRVYEFGVRDCFEAVRDWFIDKNIQSPPRNINWEVDWAEQGIDYIGNYFETWGLKEVKDNSLEYGDVLVFKMFMEVPDHIGVYTGNDNFFHHAVDRLSCEENLWEYWGKYLYKVLRHEKANTLRR
tara:strand:+ start:1751 stop:2464 length:714 start_codon:yes stop_codon:yes gene_type:complete